MKCLNNVFNDACNGYPFGRKRINKTQIRRGENRPRKGG